MPRPQQQSHQASKDADKEAKLATLQKRLGPKDFDWLCKILTEEAEKQAKLVAMKERIGPKVFDWSYKTLTETSSPSRPPSQDDSFTSKTQSAQSSPEVSGSSPLSTPPSETSLKRKATDSKAGLIDKRKPKKTKEAGRDFRPVRPLKRKVIESYDEEDDQEVDEPAAKKTKENDGAPRPAKRRSRKTIISDDEDEDVASAPKEKAEMNNEPKGFSSKDTDKTVVPAAPKPSVFSLKAAKHKHGESPTESIFSRGPDRDYKPAMTSTRKSFLPTKAAQEAKVWPKDNITQSAPIDKEAAAQKMKKAREIAERLGKSVIKPAKPAVTPGQLETSTTVQALTDQAAGATKAAGKAESQRQAAENDGPIQSPTLNGIQGSSNNASGSVPAKEKAEKPKTVASATAGKASEVTSGPNKSAQPVHGQAPPREATQPRTPVGYNGLTNGKARCYQNATYQNLANLPGLERQLDSLAWAQHDPDTDPNLKLPQTDGVGRAATSERKQYREDLRRVKSSLLITPRVRKVFKDLRRRSTGITAICARSIGEVLACVIDADAWNGDTQQDAAEFQRLLLERLEEEERIKSGASSKEATDVHRLFRSGLKQTIECSGCGRKSEQTSSSSSLTLEVPKDVKSTTLPTLLANYFRPERLDDYRCEGCGETGLISKAYRLMELPEYLVVTLNRTQDLGNGRYVKKTAKVPISTNSLNMADFCDQSCDSGSQSYSFCGLVQHEGPWMNSGHYKAVCRAQDGVWRLFNDDEVHRLVPGEVARYDKGQTFFFRRRG